MVRNTSTSAPSARDTTATTSPGADCSSSEARTSPAWAAPVWPTVVDRSSASAPSRTPSLRPRALAARPCMPVTTTRSTSSAVTPAAFRPDCQASVPERHVAGLAEPLLPRPGAPVARRPPAVEELVGDRRPAQVLGDHGRARRVVADQDGGGAVAPGRPRRPTWAGRRAGRTPPPGWCRTRRRRGRCAGRRAPSAGRRRSRRPPPRRAGAGRRARWRRWSCRGRPAWPWRTTGRRGAAAGRRAQGPAGGLDAHGRGVLVVGGHRSGALAPAGPEHRGDLGPLQAPVGDVAGDADDASGHAVPPVRCWCSMGGSLRRGVGAGRLPDRCRGRGPATRAAGPVCPPIL